MADVSISKAILWQSPPDVFVLDADEVHVWRADLNADAETIARCRAILSREERVRADRFVRSEHGAHFTCARGALRCLLGRYLGCRPGAVEFEYDDDRKPRLRDVYPVDLRFNVSHSRDKALFAFNVGRDIGVDIERLDPTTECAKIARRFFSAAETATLLELPETRHTEAFFNCWTRKEAYVKARGQGLAFGLDRFEVSLAPGEPARMIAINDPSDAAENWVLRDLRPFPGFAATIAAHRATTAWDFFEITPENTQ